MFGYSASAVKLSRFLVKGRRSEPVPRAFDLSHLAATLLGCFFCRFSSFLSETSPLRSLADAFDLLPAIRTRGRYLGRFA